MWKSFFLIFWLSIIDRMCVLEYSTDVKREREFKTHFAEMKVLQIIELEKQCFILVLWVSQLIPDAVQRFCFQATFNKSDELLISSGIIKRM